MEARLTRAHRDLPEAANPMPPALDTDLHPQPAASPRRAPSPPAISDGELVMGRAKGALMLRYGIDSWTAFRGICEGNPQTAVRQRPLLRWLEQQLRHHDLDLVRATSPPATVRDR